MSFPSAALAHVDGYITPFNPDIANGLAVKHMNDVEKYVDEIFELTAKGFPPGLTYDGYERCKPTQEFAETTKKKANRCVFDVARSDVYMVKYKFSYNGERLHDKSIYLPFVGRAGQIHISSSRFAISPVLADRVISVGMESVFAKLNKAKLTFNKAAHSYVANNEREDVDVIWGDLHNKSKQPNAIKPTVRGNCTLAHYLMCKHGMKEAFMRFAGCEPIVGGAEITPELYPESDWIICKSTQIKPKGFGKGIYAPSEIRVVVPRHKYTPMVRNMLAGFFYVVDLFPSHVQASFVDDQRGWMVLLGHLIWSGNVSYAKLLSDVSDHIASLDVYVDRLTTEKLRDLGYECYDFYEFLAIIIDKFEEWNKDADDRVSTMYDKELSILPFVCYQIVTGINNLYFKLIAAQKKGLTVKKIENLMSIYLTQGMIFKISREHGEVSVISTSGDNMALKITNMLVPQSASNRTKGKRERASIKDPAKRLHASIAEVGQVFSLPKAEPSGRSRVALTLQLSETGLVIRRESFRAMLDSAQERIRHRTESVGH